MSIKKFYCNSANFSFSVFDFMIELKNTIWNVQESSEDETIALFLSPQHAKVFAEILGNQVKEYEEQHGEIKLPEEYHPAISQ